MKQARIIRTDGSLSAIAVPSSLLGSLKWQNVADAAYASFITVVILGTLGILSAYLPDIGKPLDENLRAIDLLDLALADVLSHSARALVVAGDL